MAKVSVKKLIFEKDPSVALCLQETLYAAKVHFRIFKTFCPYNLDP